LDLLTQNRFNLLLLWLLLPLFCFAQNQGDDNIVFLPEGGFYKDSIEVQLSCSNANIFYTLDGTTPGIKSKKYNHSIKINNSVVLRAIAYKNGKRVGLSTQSFFINEPSTELMIVSLAVPPNLLFNKKVGLFMPGEHPGKNNWKMPNANFWNNKEILCNAELFESNGYPVCDQLCGFRIFGGISRLFPQKSIALSAREKYGNKKFDYPIFGKNAPKKFKHLVLRNSGSDWGKSHFRDALITSLVKKWDIDIQDYRPAQVYINGKYWGIYNIREKINRYYIASHHGINKDSVDLIEHKNIVKYGSIRYYAALLKFIHNHNFKRDYDLQLLDKIMDVDNFMNYQITEIYCDNQDAGGNIRYWRPHNRYGRWRWILFDTDFGFGLHNPDAFRMNTLALHTDPKGPSWPNPPWSTYILRKLLSNEGFRARFITRFCDHLNASFSPKTTKAVIDKIYNNLVNEMPRHLKRWNLDSSMWADQVDIIRNFGEKRPDYMRIFIADMFKPGKQCILHVETSLGGKVILNNTITIDTAGFDGKYFTSLNGQLKASAGFGYLFDHWEGPGIFSKERTIQIPLDQPVNRIRAVFTPHIHPLANQIVINEISNSNKKSGDWIEFYNNSTQEINLKNWVLTDSKHEFYLPDTPLHPNQYIVLCQDLRKFKKVFSHGIYAIGSFRFGLSKVKETINLYADNLSLVDKVYYELTPGDSLRSMALLSPQLDNENPDNWEFKLGTGSPGVMNPVQLKSTVTEDKSYYLNLGIIIGISLLLGLILYWQWYRRN